MNINFLSNKLRHLIVSRVEITEEDARTLRQLNEKSGVLYILRNYGESEYALLESVLTQLHLPLPSVHVPPSIIEQPEFWLTSILSSMDPPQNQLLTTALKNKKHAVISLFKRKGIEENNIGYQPLINIIHEFRNKNINITIIPIIPIWSKPLIRNPLPLESLIGQDDSPSMIRKLGAMVSGGLKPKVTIGSPINLKEFIEQNSSETSGNLANLLIKIILDDMQKVWRSSIGPKITPRRKIQESLLKSKEIQLTIQKELQLGKSPKEITSQLFKIIEEIPADPSLSTIAGFKKLLEILWKILYQGFEVDKDGMKRISKAQKQAPLLIVPAHRSHIDYLVLAWIMEKFDISLPYVAAGRNLSFWPLGPLFRGAGAFFIRRTMKGDNLYKSVLKEYLAQVLRNEINLEFFIEGGRSRTGKVLYPKTGLLALIGELLLEKRIPDPIVVPLSIGYEKVIEENSYLLENEGKPKENENLQQLIHASKFLLNNYGKLNIRVGKEFQFSKLLGKVTIGSNEFKEKINHIALTIIKEIAESTLITPSMVAAGALLASGSPVIDKEKFRDNAYILLNLLKKFNIIMSSPLILHPTEAIEEALKMLSYIEVAGDRIYINPKYRKTLVYYKNGLLSPLGWAALAALAKKAGGDKVTFTYLWKIFSRELPQTILLGTQEIMKRAEHLEEKEISLLSKLLEDILEGQTIILEEMSIILSTNTPITFSFLVSKIKKGIDSRLRRGEIKKQEGMNVYVIKETIQWAHDNGLLIHKRDKGIDEIQNANTKLLYQEYLLRKNILDRMR